MNTSPNIFMWYLHWFGAGNSLINSMSEYAVRCGTDPQRDGEITQRYTTKNSSKLKKKKKQMAFIFSSLLRFILCSKQCVLSERKICSINYLLILMIWPSTPRFRIDLTASLVQMHSPIMFASIIARKSRVLLSSNSIQLLESVSIPRAHTLHARENNSKHRRRRTRTKRDYSQFIPYFFSSVQSERYMCVR